MARPTAVALLALLACQDATQITVELRGVGFTCRPDGQGPSLSTASVIAKPQLGTSLDTPGAVGTGSDCRGDEPRALGSVVLLPSGEAGPVDVLAVVQLVAADGTENAPDACIEAYQRSLRSEAIEQAGFDRELCIYGRRSLAFLPQHSLTVSIELSTACAGVVCGPSLTCEPGRGCVSAATRCEDDGSCAVSGGAGSGAGDTGGAGGGAGAAGSGYDEIVRISSGMAYASGFVPATRWQVWARSLSPQLGYFAADIGDRIFLADLNQLSPVACVDPVLPVVSGVWGFDDGSGISLYAVGSKFGVSWLGRAKVGPGNATFNWQDLQAPGSVGVPRSVWVGPDGASDAHIAVVGDGGVAYARLADVLAAQ